VDQQELWTIHTQQIRVSDIVARYHHPFDFQAELALLINDICQENNYGTAIEVGCESGITSMLLRADVEATYFDLNGDIVQKVKRACEQLNKRGRFVVGDMFAMGFRDKSYDVVFNSGVLEHYDENDRIRILREYSRILRDNGTMVLGIPNHYSLPYRSAYVLKKKILRGYQWPWPEEHRIYDLREELRATGLRLVKRLTLAKESLFGFWHCSRVLRKLWVWSDRMLHYEGYLSTLVIRKRRTEGISEQC
jgi:SAM-dependent methyltransferase